jgi:cell wall-associated NlpC family hydrolase
MGAVFPHYANGKFQLASKPGNVQLSVIDSANNPPTENNIINIATKYINAPYLWGGRTPFGIDCSGFVQMVFRFLGIKLYRDAYQQAEQGRMVEFINQTQTGDLAFFDNKHKRIIHVGIILPDRKIIHASGQVRIDTMDHYGIFNADTNSYSHKLRVIRRLI